MGYAEEFAATAADARSLLDGLDEAAFNWRPGPQRWSIGECLSHLTVTGDLYITQIERAIETGRARGLTGTGPFALGWFGGWFKRFLEPPPKRKVPVPGGFAPKSDLGLDPARTAYLAANGRLQALAGSADGLDLGRIRMRSPLSRLIWFNLAAGFAVVAAHERRHLWQARQVRDLPEFPGG